MHDGREKVAKALDALTEGLYPFVERELKAVYREDWHDVAQSSFRENRGQVELKGDVIRWDASALLTVMWDQWNRVFRHRLGQLERSLVAELRDFRNRWAHQAAFGFNDTFRILDSVERLLAAVDAEKVRDRIAREKTELLRQEFGREARAAYRKSQISRRKWQDLAIYFVCCLSILFVILQELGTGAWILMLLVVAVFIYLGYYRTSAPPLLFFGPHECTACGRIIYGEACPYCEAAPMQRVAAQSEQPVSLAPRNDEPPPDTPERTPTIPETEREVVASR